MERITNAREKCSVESRTGRRREKKYASRLATALHRMIGIWRDF